ncbi:hypothetical protein DMH26_36485 [Streptomyces sp. WAC 05379]|uniref:hypothetical protein n=1 Tax=Streptomyces sp. WAC 05379 TaxID=2203207 RepID=UPI000F73ECF4|nr:hypothetical protein [Streptomyces sp. WAC 05379]RSN81874.1 hypothetical protein DMH26_36485 [Streptomyces sp. WAC 05379]
MPETTTPATELTSHYVAQVTGDLERNAKEQERISAEIASLQEQLAAVQHDHTVLVNVQQALGITQAPAQPAAEAESAAVPSPRQKTGAARGRKKAGKATAAPKKAAARKPAAKRAEAAKAAQPTLVELIRRHLAGLEEPRSAAEISAALGQAHPERQFADKVVRVTLEGLVAKSQAERTKQGRSVFYTSPKSADASETEAQAAETER